MTEVEWLACTDPTPMLGFLQGKTSERKLRLSACAIAAGLLGELEDEESRRIIEAVERFTENADLKDYVTATANILSPMRGTFYRSYREEPPYVIPGSIIVPDMLMGLVDSDEGLCGVEAECFGVVIEVLAESAMGIEEDALLFRIIPLDDVVPHHRHDSLTHLLRCIIGNPFRPITINPAWQTPTVVALAQAAYDNRILPAGTLEPDRLAVLADALEEAGCDNNDILDHCRGPGEHVRGCWVLDLLLGKE